MSPTKHHFTGVDQTTGKRVRVVVEATSVEHAIERVARRGIAVTGVARSSSESTGSSVPQLQTTIDPKSKLDSVSHKKNSIARKRVHGSTVAVPKTRTSHRLASVLVTLVVIATLIPSVALVARTSLARGQGVKAPSTEDVRATATLRAWNEFCEADAQLVRSNARYNEAGAQQIYYLLDEITIMNADYELKVAIADCKRAAQRLSAIQQSRRQKINEIQRTVNRQASEAGRDVGNHLAESHDSIGKTLVKGVVGIAAVGGIGYASQELQIAAVNREYDAQYDSAVSVLKAKHVAIQNLRPKLAARYSWN